MNEDRLNGMLVSAGLIGGQSADDVRELVAEVRRLRAAIGALLREDNSYE